MTNPLQSSPALYDILMHFGHLSLYKDNCSKSCLNQITKINLYTLVSFPMGPMLNVTYLHLQLAVPFSNTLRINYEALLKKLQDLCSSLRSTWAYWAGKIALTVLYLLWTLRVPILSLQLDTLQRILNTFICNSKHPRIKHFTMCTAMSKAGMSLIN